MKIAHAWLQEYFKETLPQAEVLADLFTFHSFEIEEVYDGHLQIGKIIDAKILPDRAHFCLSYRGIADEVEVLTGLSRISPANDEIKIDESVPKVEARIQDDKFCRRYISRYVRNISIGESGEAIKAKLLAMDGRSINAIVDATNIAMFDCGQPLHVFDADKVKGTIVIREALPEEKIILLDGKEISLSSADFVIADDEGPLAIAGVKGGKRAEVTTNTTNIIIEAANFHPTAIRKTSTKYNLRNESSKRFENEITPELAMDGMMRISGLISASAPEASFGPITDLYPHPIEKTSIVTTAEFINKKLGITISREDILVILKKLSIEIEEKGNELVLTIPYHRLDLMIPEDVVEEVGRIHGYEKIKGTEQSNSGSEAAANPGFYTSERIKTILVNEGFSEAYLYALVPEGDFEVTYPLAYDKKSLRTNLSEGMAKALEINARNADLLFLDSIKMFEIGRVFTKEGEHTSLCIGIKRIKKVKGQSANEDIRQLREQLLAQLEVDIVTVCTVDDTGGIMRLKGKEIGTINHLDGIMELNLDMLIPHVKVPVYSDIDFSLECEVTYTPFSRYPFIVRDIAVFVPASVGSKEIEDIIASNGSSLLLKYRLFDTFQKDEKVSYAFRMIFQSFERTLTDEEVSVVIKTIEEKIKDRGWEVR